MNSPLSFRTHIALGCCLLFASTLLMAIEAKGQEIRQPLVPAPPPMAFVPRNERTQLLATRDAKGRTRAAIELAEARLSRSEQLTALQQYDGASAELGIYQGLIEDALDSLAMGKKDSNKHRDTYKRLELALRSHCARLEAIRRITPTEYAVNIKAICECARNARTEALNAFYGDTVVREVSAEDHKVSRGEATKDPMPAAVKQP